MARRNAAKRARAAAFVRLDFMLRLVTMSSFRLVLLSAVGLAALALLGFSLWTLRAPLRSAWQLWRAAPTSRSTLTFAVVGDNHGVNPIYRQILRELPGQRPSFLLNLADTSERGETAEDRTGSSPAQDKSARTRPRALSVQHAPQVGTRDDADQTTGL